jgi:protein subunit release factor B
MTGFPLQIEADVRRRLGTLGVSPGDVAEKFVHGTGPGGQKINKTASTVWLRHRPTGAEVRCQAERSQAVNRVRAWRELADKLERRARAAAEAVQAARESQRRRTRQKSRAQKVRMIQSKQHRARIKLARRPGGDEW